jgi:hypothetical protein
MNPLSLIPAPYRFIALALIAAVIVGGAYLKGRGDGKAVVQAELDEQRATWQQQFDRQVADSAAKEAEFKAIAKAKEDEIKASLEAATVAGADLAARLRNHQRAGRCAVSQPAGAAGGADGTSGIDADSDPVEQATGRHIEACARDAERLNGWIDWFHAVSVVR